MILTNNFSEFIKLYNHNQNSDLEYSQNLKKIFVPICS